MSQKKRIKDIFWYITSGAKTDPICVAYESSGKTEIIEYAPTVTTKELNNALDRFAKPEEREEVFMKVVARCNKKGIILR